MFNAKKIIIWVIFWLSLIVLAFLFFSDHKLNADEGMVLNSAWQLYHGKIMYYDFFQYTTPASAYIIYWLWNLFGSASYLIAKIFSIIFAMFSLVGIYLILKKLTKKKVIIIFSVLLWLIALRYYPLINHNVYSSFIAVWFFYILLLALEQNKKYLCIISGAVLAVLFLFLQTKGLVLFIISILYIFLFASIRFKEKIKLILLIMIGFVFMIAPVLLFWDFQTLFYSWFIFPFSADYMGHTSIFIYLIALEIFISFVMVISALKLKDKTLWLLAFFQIGLFLSTTNVIDVPHLMINSFPLWIFLALMVEKFIVRVNLGVKLAIFPLSIIIISFVFISFYLRLPPFDYNIYNIDILDKKIGIFVATKISEIKDAEHIYAAPFMPGIYFELDKPNPFYYSDNMALCDDQCLDKTLITFKKVAPEFVFFDLEMAEKFNYDSDNPLDNFIKQNYILCQDSKSSSLLIYARNNCQFTLIKK